MTRLGCVGYLYRTGFRQVGGGANGKVSSRLGVVRRGEVYNLSKSWNPLLHNFLSMFISILYMFRATMCPSSGDTTVFIRHLAPATLYG
jgi:hypothetical protein